MTAARDFGDGPARGGVGGEGAASLPDPRPGRIVTADALAAACREIHQRQVESIVFTNGCFDLLHAGHVATIQFAAGQGDVLIVAVHSDDSVRRLKGPDRPVVPQGERAYLLACLAGVRYVVIQEDDTPHRLLEMVRPHVLVKGGAAGQVEDAEVLRAAGRRVARGRRVPGVSTTIRMAQLVQTGRGTRRGTRRGPPVG